MSIGQHQNLGIRIFFTKHITPAEIHMFLPKGIDTSPGRPNSGFIRIINQNQSGNVAAQHPNVFDRQRGTERSNRIFNTVLMEGQQIEITFDDVNAFRCAAFVFCQIQSIQRPTLAVNRRFRRIEIFGQRIIHHPPTKANNSLVYINNRECNTIPKTIIITPSALFGQNQSASFNFCKRYPAFGKKIDNIIPPRRRISETKAFNDFR